MIKYITKKINKNLRLKYLIYLIIKHNCTCYLIVAHKKSPQIFDRNTFFMYNYVANGK